MIPVLKGAEYAARLAALKRPGSEKLLAFYDHAVGAICRDPHWMLLPLDDHIVHRGDGIFETIRFTERKVIHPDLHLDRLERSAAGISLPLPCSRKELQDLILEVCAVGNEPEGNIRILIGRGPGGFGISPRECPDPSLHIAVFKVDPLPEKFYLQGITAFRSSIPVRQPLFAKIKTTNYLPGVLMSLEAEKKQMDMALSFDEHDCLTEAAIANVCAVDASGALAIPEFRNALTGTVITRIMELARRFMPVHVRTLPASEIPSLRELMLVGTVYECLGITHFDGKPIGNGKPGPVALKLRSMLRQTFLETGLPF